MRKTKCTGEEQQQDAAHFNAADVTTYVQDNFFWAYAMMCVSLQSLLEGLASWAESCVCHGSRIHDALEEKGNNHSWRNITKQFSRFVGEAQVSWANCPMCGKRAPEMCAGGLGATCSALQNTSEFLLIAECEQLLDPGRRTELLVEFAAARDHLLYVLTAKT